jgi:selenocysteine-specific translation elongation factor
MAEELIGTVNDFFARPVVAGIVLTGSLNAGDKIHIKGHTTDFEMNINSMQMNNVNVTQAKSGDSIGVKVKDRCRAGDHVYKVTQ